MTPSGHDRTDAAVPVRAGLFTDTGTPHLLGSRCGACHNHAFPASDTCPYCSAEGTELVELSPAGTLWAWTAVTSAPPGYRGTVPYGFGVVELPEGLRVVTRLTEADPSRLHAGQAMELVVVPLHAGDGGDDGNTENDGHDVVGYAFAPSGSDA
ncbi:MAG: OB-fold domain-containing protein [Acidimicrobiales bacterium]